MVGGERITFLAPSYPRFPGGGSRVYVEHANQLARRGYQVSIVHSLGVRPKLLAGLADRARNKIRDLRAGSLRRRISWIHVDPQVQTIMVDQLDDRTRLPEADLYVATYWQTSELLGTMRTSAAKLQLIQAYETWAGPADRVDATWRLPMTTAVVSRALLHKGAELGVPEERLFLVPNGIDHSTFRITTPIAGRPPAVAFLAHEPPVKGLPTAIETIRLIREKQPYVSIIAFGGGPRPAILPRDIRYLHRPVGAELVEQVYNRCSVFLCPSVSEGFGFPSIEAMACGAALVSTSNGGVEDFARDGKSALIAPVGDAAALADAALSLLSDDGRRRVIAEAGVRSAANFDWSTSGEAFHQAVRAALDSRNADQ